MVDKDTRLDNSLSASAKEFHYNYTLVNYAKADIDTIEFKKALKPLFINTLRTNPSMQFFKDNQVAVSYNYKDKAGLFVCAVHIEPEEYQ